MAEVQKMHYSDNVIDVLVESQKGLDSASQQALQLASCIGASFDLKTLSVISKRPASETIHALEEPLQLNMVVPLDKAHQYVNLQEEEWLEVNPQYRFQHDRIQEAAYFMIPDNKKEEREKENLGGTERRKEVKEENSKTQKERKNKKQRHTKQK